MADTILSTIIVLFMGEFLPKTIFKNNANFLLDVMAFPTYVCYILLYPISKACVLISKAMLKLLGVNLSQEKTKEEFSKELCFRFQKPIVSTSANISGEPTAQTFEEISDDIKNAVDYVVKYNRQCKEKHKPSSIIKIDASGKFQIIRE